VSHLNRSPRQSKGSTPTEKVLDRLEGVKPSKPGSWIAICPAHEDKSPSLSVRELEDGRVLIHCFAGCEVSEILRAIGLTITDLFARPRANYLEPVKGGFSAAELLMLIAHEVTVAAILATDAQKGPLNEVDLDRLLAAAGRIGTVRGYAYGYQ
jgi:hypothetical protein